MPHALAIARKLGWHYDIMSTSFFLSRRALKPATHSGMPRWQDRLFIMLARSANDATSYFQLLLEQLHQVERVGSAPRSAPQVTSRPPRFSTSSEPVNPSPPTCSNTTSTPFLLVSLRVIVSNRSVR